MSTSTPNNDLDNNAEIGRLAYLLKLVDTLHTLPDACAIGDLACRMLAENLPAEYAWSARIGPDRQQVSIRTEFTTSGSIHLAGDYPVHQVPSLARLIEAQQPFIMDDVFRSPNIGSAESLFYETNRIRSCMAFPVATGQQIPGCIAVGNSIPHHWTAREVSLTHETAIRIGNAIRWKGADCSQIASHDLKTDQTSIAAYRHLIQKQIEEIQDERASLLQRLNSQAARIYKLIRKLLDTTPVAGEIPSAPVPKEFE